jgi:hypothetical protein
MKISISYINDSDYDITVVGRNNLPTTVSKVTMNHSNEFIIRKTYKFVGIEAIKETLRNINSFKDRYNRPHNSEIMLIGDELTRLRTRDINLSVAEIYIDHHVDVSSLKATDGLYITCLDLMIQLGKYNVSILHPFSEEGKAFESMANFIANKKVSGFFIEVVDNEHNISSRFIYGCKDVVEVPIIRDPERSSGVYCFRLQHRNVNNEILDYEYYTFKEAEEAVGLYKTREEAIAGGNPQKLTDIQSVIAETELINAKNQFKKDELEREILKAKLANESFIFKNKIDDRTKTREDVLTERTQIRKEVNELLKFIPSVILGIVTIVALMHRKELK